MPSSAATSPIRAKTELATSPSKYGSKNLSESLMKASNSSLPPLPSYAAPPSPSSSRKSQLSRDPSISASSAVLELPLDIRIMVESRPSTIHYDFDGFEGKSYKSFWLLSDDEASSFEKWNRLEFERQNRLFEYFTNLLRIRFNMKRMVFHYGPAFEKSHGLTENVAADYRKTFSRIKDLYGYLDKLVSRKLKPAYEGHMFVNDRYVLKVSGKWLSNLAASYHYVSQGVVYLARLSANDTVREWIAEQEETDELAQSNRFAPSARELFTSYFIKLFTPLALIFKDLIKLYAKMEKPVQGEAVKQMYDILTQINTTSDHTTDLDNKISLNEHLVCKDVLYLEMVDLFNPMRHLSSTSMEMEVSGKTSWSKCRLVLCDNYLLPLIHRDSDLFLLKPPIPMQYLSYKVLNTNEGDETSPHLIVTDSGNEIIYELRMLKGQNMASIMINTFTKDLDKTRTAFFERMADGRTLKLINGCSFVSHTESRSVSKNGPPEWDLVTRAISVSNEASETNSSLLRPLSTTEPSCIDWFGVGNEDFLAIGANDGIYVGQQDSPLSWRRVCELTGVTRLDVLDNQTLICVANHEKLYKCAILDILPAYTGRYLCDRSFKVIQKHCREYELGFQDFRRGPVLVNTRHIFCWKDQKIRYSPLTIENNWTPEFKSMKATFNVLGVSVFYPNLFTVMNFAENMPIFYLSNLDSLTNTPLPSLDNDRDLQKRLKGQKPVASFKLSKERKVYETLLVYTNYGITVDCISKSQTFQRSRKEMMRFNFCCIDAAFDIDKSTLFVCGNQGLEMWHIPSGQALQESRPKLISCVTGRDVRLLNRTPGKITVSLLRPDEKGDHAFLRKILLVG
ncbi:DEKNAAC105664 [Brettanomyces naardenensis]|uniref:DEKNAAC105664 n=1 Tax=Brettanomyces naardenensis TaxID=13370 RepID=A0A448YTX1_BRENA|nr:DEKNAAC105664 [Brettanomyces naardenensis]